MSIAVPNPDRFTGGIALLGVVTCGLPVYNILIDDGPGGGGPEVTMDSRAVERRGL